jgi:endo-1,3(4)-beta-glucanase
MPRIQTGVYFKTVTRVTKFPKPHVTKFNFNLEDGTSWRLYAFRTKGDELELEVTNNTLAQSKKPFFGSIHIAKDPQTPGSEQTLDDGAGVYPVTLKLAGSASHEHGSYSFNFQREGHAMGNLYMYALPHHVESFDHETTKGLCKVQLQTTTKGLATLVQGSRWTMIEKLPMHMNLAPWHPEKGNMTKLSDRAKGLIHSAAQKELTQNMVAQSNLDSMYFSGKV